MKRLNVLVTACIFMMAICFIFEGNLNAQTATQDPNQPQSPPSFKPTIKIDPACKARIAFDNDSWNFGSIPKGAIVLHNFGVENKGQDTLIITKVKPTCGCTIAPVSNDKVPPGGTAYVAATFNTQKFNGRVEKWIYIESNDPINPYMKVSFTAVINDPTQVFKIDPLEPDFGGVKIGEKSQIKINLINGDSLDHMVAIVEEPAKSMMSTTLAGDIIKAGKSMILTMDLAPQADTTTLHKSVTIEAKDNPDTRITIPIRATIIQ